MFTEKRSPPMFVNRRTRKMRNANKRKSLFFFVPKYRGQQTRKFSTWPSINIWDRSLPRKSSFNRQQRPETIIRSLGSSPVSIAHATAVNNFPIKNRREEKPSKKKAKLADPRNYFYISQTSSSSGSGEFFFLLLFIFPDLRKTKTNNARKPRLLEFKRKQF